jgi:SnoaL-like domain
VPGFVSDSPLARDLIRIGDEAIAREDGAALRAYFAEDYVFHGPGGDLGFDQLSAYFASLRAAFTDLRLVREQIITDGNFLAARTTFSGDFTAVFTYSPIGPVEPPDQARRHHDGARRAEEVVAMLTTAFNGPPDTYFGHAPGQHRSPRPRRRPRPSAIVWRSGPAAGPIVPAAATRGIWT